MMKATYAAALLLAWAPSAGSFSVSRAPLALRPLQRRAVVAPAPMMISLPGFGGGSKVPEGPSEEAQGLYRMLGVTEDADYDEINRAYEDLCNKYKGETKRLIKLQVAKDKILEDRLRLRMSGALKSTVSSDDWRVADNRKEAKKSLQDMLPPMLADIVMVPSRKLLVKNALVFGGISLLPALSREWVTSSISLGFGLGLFLLYNRGLPDTGGKGGMDGETRPPKVKPLAMTAGITFLAGALGAAASLVLPLRFLMQELAISLCCSLAFFTSCTFFQVQDEY